MVENELVNMQVCAGVVNNEVNEVAGRKVDGAAGLGRHRVEGTTEFWVTEAGRRLRVR